MTTPPCAVENDAHRLGIAIGDELVRPDEAERRTPLKRVLRRVGGRIPMVMNVGEQGTTIAVDRARAAEEEGTDDHFVRIARDLAADRATGRRDGRCDRRAHDRARRRRRGRGRGHLDRGASAWRTRHDALRGSDVDSVAQFNCHERDDVDDSPTVFDARIASIDRIDAQQDDLFHALYKCLLVLRDIFRTAHVRGPTGVVDETARNEVERIVDPYRERFG